nr:DUF1127 domain-containing protein [uncultured Dongia sp.]
MSIRSLTAKSLAAREQQASPTGQGLSLIALVATWMRTSADRARQRRALARLNDFDLRDIGLTRRDVEDETAKPFWRM